MITSDNNAQLQTDDFNITFIISSSRL